VFTALVFIFLRVYVKILRGQKFALSDFFIILAWLAFVACCGCDIELNKLGLFALGRTYEQKLITVNTDRGKTIEVLKVSFLKVRVKDR
jgi:hypothetical protein